MVRHAIMTHIICIANQKGGVGKTTTAINLSAALAEAGNRVLMVDCDPQANATSGIGMDRTVIHKNLYHGLIGETPIRKLIVDTEIDGLKAVPSHVDLTGFEVEMMSHPERGVALKKLLDEIKNEFDYILLDCPPSLGLLTVNALVAATSLLIPLQCEFYAFKGLIQLTKTVERIRNHLNPRLTVAGILLTMFDQRTNLSQQVAEKAKQQSIHRVFNTTIPRNVRLGEAPIVGKPVLQFDPASAGARSYVELAKEIING